MGAQLASLTAGSILDAMKRSNPTVPDREVAIIKEVLDQEFAKAFIAPDGLQAKIVEMSARHFTHSEIRALLDFYGTDVGRKAVAEMPALLKEGAAAGQAWAAQTCRTSACSFRSGSAPSADQITRRLDVGGVTGIERRRRQSRRKRTSICASGALGSVY